MTTYYGSIRKQDERHIHTVVINDGNLSNGNVSQNNILVFFCFRESEFYEEELVWLPFIVVDDLHIQLTELLVVGEVYILLQVNVVLGGRGGPIDSLHAKTNTDIFQIDSSLYKSKFIVLQYCLLYVKNIYIV